MARAEIIEAERHASVLRLQSSWRRNQAEKRVNQIRERCTMMMDLVDAAVTKVVAEAVSDLVVEAVPEVIAELTAEIKVATFDGQVAETDEERQEARERKRDIEDQLAWLKLLPSSASVT